MRPADGDGHRRAFVTQVTIVECAPRVPEIALHLATDITALWQLTEADMGAAGMEPPFWAFAWAGGQALARHLLDTPAEVRGLRVLDLAAGSGLCGLAALRAGAEQVLAVDIDPLAGAAITLNAEANGLSGLRVHIGDLLGQHPPAGYDVVIAGDVCYDREMTTRVMSWLRLAQAAGSRVLLGDPRRAYLPEAGLTQLATYDVPTTGDLEGREICPTTVFALS